MRWYDVPVMLFLSAVYAIPLVIALVIAAVIAWRVTRWLTKNNPDKYRGGFGRR